MNVSGHNKITGIGTGLMEVKKEGGCMQNICHLSKISTSSIKSITSLFPICIIGILCIKKYFFVFTFSLILANHPMKA